MTSVDYRHVPTGTLAVLAQRLGKVSASPSTWYRLVRTYGWRRPRLTPALPEVTDEIVSAVQQWEYEPLVRDKMPTPFCKIVALTIHWQ